MPAATRTPRKGRDGGSPPAAATGRAGAPGSPISRSRAAAAAPRCCCCCCCCPAWALASAAGDALLRRCCCCFSSRAAAAATSRSTSAMLVSAFSADVLDPLFLPKRAWQVTLCWRVAIDTTPPRPRRSGRPLRETPLNLRAQGVPCNARSIVDRAAAGLRTL